MKKVQLFFAVFMAFLSFTSQAQDQQNYGAEIVSHQKFGEGLMVTRAQMIPMSGVVSNLFFYNRADEPWNDNVWYEYDWELRGKVPSNGWSQIRVRPEDGAQLKSAAVDISASVNLGDDLYNYILIRKDDTYVYDIRKDFNISSYNYNNASAHSGNSASLVVGGPRIYQTGGNLDHIPSWYQLDFSIGITAFDNGWAGALPDGDYSEDFVIDYTRFYTYSGNNLNTNPQWQDEFNNNSLDYGKWFPATWDFYATQFRPENISFENGMLRLKVNRGDGSEASTNLALDGNASQSSTSYGGSASRAIDNNTNGNWSSGTITHTNPSNQNNAWWKVDLQENSSIEKIVLFNRTNCCSDRLSNFTVSVLDAIGNTVWSQYYNQTPSPSLEINLNATGKTVQVSLNGILSLAEVQVYGSPSNDGGNDPYGNLALSGSANQSSTGWSGVANRAIDNNTNGSYGAGSVTHTTSSNNSWWEVDLQQTSEIDKITIFNRTDNCCTSRLSNFTVSVLDQNGGTVWSQYYSNTPNPSLTINLTQTGKKVRVSLNGTLSLAEVQVFGYAGVGNRGETSDGFFLARKDDGQKVDLSWTLLEQENTPIQFEVEHMNANGEYEMIGFVGGNRSEFYDVHNFLHDAPHTGANTYRIKAVFADYSVQYLLPQTVTFEANDLSIAYPNPNNGQLFINLTDYKNEAVSFILTDLTGKVYLTEKVDQNHNQTIEMDLSNFRNGFYLLYVKPANGIAKTEKISLMNTY